MEFLTYKKYKSQEESSFLTDLLEKNKLEFRVVNIAPSLDITFTGYNEFDDKIAIKLKPEDFIKANELLVKNADSVIDTLDKDHYLFGFSDEELIEILERFDEWSETDFLLAKKILLQRGHKITSENIEKLRCDRIEELKQPEKGQKGWMLFGFICAAFGGLLGIFIGYFHFRFKKRILTGERVYAYDLKTRKLGLRMLIIGAISLSIFIFSMLFWLIYI